MKRSKAYRAAAESIDATQLHTAEEALALAPERGWVVVSMKETFRRIFPTPRPRSRGAR